MISVSGFSKKGSTVAIRSILFAFMALSGCTKGSSPAVSEGSSVLGSRGALAAVSPEQKKKFHTWLAREMLEQVFGEAPRGGEAVAKWVNILEQGAEIQGVYHGIILSTEYASRNKPRSTDVAVRFFSEEVAILRSGKSEWDSSLAPIALEIQNRVKAESIFFLKRELGRLVLERVSGLAGSPIALAKFYSETAVRLSKQGINFGLTQRNLGDLSFHKEWADGSSRGMIEWELLNRYHRCLNRLGGITPAGR